MRKTFAGIGVVLLAWFALSAAEALKPGEPVDCRAIVFNPDKWENKGHSLKLVPWTGRKVVLLTTTANHDPAVMARFLDRLDEGWRVYSELTGRSPGLFKQLGGKPTINAIPDGSLTCGYGCGYIGVSGIEVAGFYGNDYPLVSRDADAFPH